MANLTKCAICDNTYSYCPNCANTHAWKFYTDTHECYQIFMVIMQYKKGLMPKDEAKGVLEHLGITLESNFDNYRQSVAKTMKEILTVEKTAIKPVEEMTVIKKNKKSKLYKN